MTFTPLKGMSDVVHAEREFESRGCQAAGACDACVVDQEMQGQVARQNCVGAGAYRREVAQVERDELD